MALSVDPTTGRRYLSRLPLNLRDRRVRTDLGNSQALHRRLLDAFPEAASRAGIDLLYRVEARRGGQYPEYIMLVQSAIEPDWSRLDAGYLRQEFHGLGWSDPGEAAVKEVGDTFSRIDAGERFRFRLRANPTQRRHFKEGDVDDKGNPRRPTGPNGTRMPLFDDAELHGWIVSKSAQHGFKLLGARWQPDPVTGDRQRGSKVDGSVLTHYAVLFGGVLQVTESAAFHDALVRGIGSAKAYGFGLLSLAPVSAGV